MLVSDAINKVYLRATRKNVTLDYTSTKGGQIMQLLDYFQNEWALDPNNDWHSLRTIFTVGGAVTATDTFSLASLTTLNRISSREGDYVRIYSSTNTQEWDYSIVDAAVLYNDGPTLNSAGRSIGSSYGTCAQVGTSLVFDRAFTATDGQIGGSIKIPGYSTVGVLDGPTDVIQVDDPHWLIAKCAAEYCRNDVTRQNLYPGLNDEAEVKYQNMAANNESQIETAYTPDIGLIGQTWS
jgi:hypothetical protein